MLAIMAIPTYLGAVAKALDKVSVVSAKHSSRRHFSTVSRASRAHPNALQGSCSEGHEWSSRFAVQFES